MTPFSRLVCIWALALPSLACSSKENRTGAQFDGSGPLYAVSNTLLITDSVTSYVTVVDSLEAGTEVALDRALEFPGSARAYGRERANVVYLTSSEAPTMTEVTFDSTGVPSKGRTVSFANLGVDATSGGNVNLHLSATKAYFVSQSSLEIVVWNPERMEVIKTVPLELRPPANYPDVYFYPQPILVGDSLVLLSNVAGEVSGPGVFVTVVDTRDDRIDSTTLEPRCHSLLQSGVDAGGDRYFASSDYAASEHFLYPDLVPAPCMLRMSKGALEFDAEWSRTLDGELGTGIWTGVTQGAGKLYVQGTPDDTSAIAAAAETGAYEVSVGQPWSWYSLIDGDSEPTSADTGLEFPPSFAPIPVDGDAYVAVFDDVNTTLVNLTGSDEPEPGVEVPGFVYSVVRFR
jgi:hypothetical protein